MQETSTVEEVVEGFLMSPQQRRVWSLMCEGGGAPYRAQCAASVEGRLRADVLEGAVADVVRRHEILRTSFLRPAGFDAPVQVVGDERAPAWRVVTLAGLDPARQEEAVAELFAADAALPPDPAGAGPLRLTLVELSPLRHILLLTLPALCADARTLDNLLGEVALAYAARLAGEGLGEGPDQYAQFSEWQSELLADEESAEGREFWRQTCGRADRPAASPGGELPGSGSFAPASVPFRVGPEAATALEAVASGRGVSTDVALLACWQTLLWRLADRREVSTASLFDGRKYEEMRGMLGLFARWLPVRARFDEGFRFEEVLDQLGQAAAAADEWQEYFVWGEDAALSGTASAHPEYCFEFAERLPAYSAGEVTFAARRQYVCFERFNLKLSCVGRDGGFDAELHYDTGRYTPDHAGVLAAYFQALLLDVVRDPRKAVGELDLLDEAERRKILQDWNDNRADYPREGSIHALFSRQARLTPDAAAVEFGPSSLTYRQLDAASTLVAGRLTALGVGRGSLVALCLERSAAMVAAMLGVLKAGGAYLPLDPSHPAERLAFMLEDGRAGVLLTEEGLADSLPSFYGHLVCVDADWPDLDLSGAVAADPHGADLSNVEGDLSGDGCVLAGDACSGDDLAYVIYTSGSTGTPKGIAVPHRGVLRLVLNSDYVSLSEGDRVAQAANASFDAATFEVWGPLLAGGTVVGLDRDSSLSPRELAGELRRLRVDVLFLTTALFNQVARHEPQGFGGLRELLFGGEAVDPSRVRMVLDGGAPPRRLLHVYGPTESTTFATWHEVRGVVEGARTVPIGGPLANTELYVLDGGMSPTPVGVSGELYIGGDGLARGYLNRPSLTAQRFIPHPFSTQAGARLYRTGDLVRRLSCGAVEFVGRADHQVKVRGFRVELGEVEAALCEAAGVAGAAVLALPGLDGERRLVAYVAAPGGEATAGTLRAALRGRLPEYMVPSQFVLLGELPLTANGKVDRKALPEPGSVESEGEEYEEPRTPAEELLAGIWGELLGLGRVSACANFFELGGHSLLATQVASRVREAFGVELALREVFERGSLRELAAEVERLRQEGAGVEAPAVLAVGRDGELPLSYAQQRLWFLDQLEGGGASYNVPAAVRLEGELKAEALSGALTEIVRRHEALRTGFETVDGRPVQVIAEAEQFALPLLDLSGLPAEEREREALRLAGEEARRPFDLRRAPLMRASLLRLGEEEHVLLLTMHHIVSDGWSLGVLIREVGALYTAYANGEESPLEELEVQYADYAAWQRGWLQGEVLDKQLSYWREQLSGAPPVLELPTDRPRPAVQSMRGATHGFVLGEELTAGIKALSRSEGSTLFMTLLAGFQALLSRYSGQEDVVVGTPIAGRTRGEVEGLIGFFVNTLVLRTGLGGDPTFRELLSRVREVTLGAYAHQEVPFEKLVDELQPERNLSLSPLFQVMFVLQNAHDTQEIELPGLRMSGMEAESDSSKFDITLAMSEEGDRLGASIEYNTDLFDAGTIHRFVRHFESLLAAAVASPDLTLSELPLLDQAERRALLLDFNHSGPALEAAPCLHHLFRQQALRTPDAPAIVCAGLTLSYRDLDERSDRLARRLLSLGAGPDSIVGLLMGRSAETIVAILGVLKSGAAYLPLDPNYPGERLSLMLEDSGSRLLLTEERLSDLLNAGEARVLCLDSEEERQVIASLPAGPVESGASPDNLAYVIYTSGSTGRPKGVAIAHSSAAVLARWSQSAFSPEELSRVLFSTSVCFDLSIFELFAPLCSGGAVVVAKDALELPLLGDEAGVTLVNTVPSAMAELVRQGRLPESVLTVNLAGEALKGSLAEAVYVAGAGRVCNLYGPTEDTTYSTWSEVASGGEREPVIGGPVSNTRAYVVDGRLEPAPVGVAGELYLSGDGLARGYLNRPSLTAERFVPDPHATEPGSRMYKTGDVARWLSSGELEYLGRADQQVKVRGFRIELGEIEAALSACEGVREAVVVVREAGEGGQRLVAYFAAEAGGEVSAVELRERLGRRLPHYMVPSVFVRLDELPLTPNGKVDRKALPEPDSSRPEHLSSFVAPRTRVEQTLASIWSELLRVEEVGIHDNFFELGGDSILGIQIVARAQQAGLRLTPKQLFQHQTIAELAEAVGTADLVEAEQGTVSGDVRLTPIQRQFFEAEVAEPWHYNQALMLELGGEAAAAALRRAVEALLAHHDALRMRYRREEGGGWRQECAPAEVNEVFREHEIAGDDAEFSAAVTALAEEAQRSLSLEEGPLMRAVYMRREGGSGRLLLVIHHLVVDGVSWRILLEDLAAVYEQARAGAQTLALPRKTTSFRQWAARLEEYAQTEAAERELAYWERELGGAAGRLRLDAGGADAAALNVVGSMAQVTATLGEEETRALLTEVPKKYRTRIDDVLLAALARAYSRWGGGGRLLVEVEGHGREEEVVGGVDLSRTVGWFTSFYPVALADAPGDDGALLKGVKEQLRNVPQRGLGYGALLLVGREEARRRMAALPRPEVGFNYLGQLDQALREDGPLRPARESSGLGRSPAGRRPYLLEITGGVAGGELKLTWMYCAALQGRESVERLAGEFVSALRELIEHCRREDAGGFTPSDFPEAALSQEDLDELVAELSE